MRTLQILATLLILTVGTIDGRADDRPATPQSQPASPPAAAPAAPAAERYYMLIYGTQTVPPWPRYSHTWATFVRTVATPSGEMVASVDTVSWLPETKIVRPQALRPEPGKNLTLEETVELVQSNNGRISAWGPYEIDSYRYVRFIARKEELESGKLLYRAIGGLTRNSNVTNCGQSFAHSSPIVGRRWQPTPKPGEDGTSHLALRYLRVGALLNNGAEHPWLLKSIGADYFPVTYRKPGERVPPR
jgi:hypothetical protein